MSSLPDQAIPSETKDLPQKCTDGCLLYVLADATLLGLALTLLYPWVKNTLGLVDIQFMRHLWMFVQVMLALSVGTLLLMVLTAHQLRAAYCSFIAPFAGSALQSNFSVGILLKLLLIAFIYLNIFAVSTLQPLLIYAAENLYPFNRNNNTAVPHLNAIDFIGQPRAASLHPGPSRSAMDTNESQNTSTPDDASQHGSQVMPFDWEAEMMSTYSLSARSEDSRYGGQTLGEDLQGTGSCPARSSSALSNAETRLGNQTMLVNRRETQLPCTSGAAGGASGLARPQFHINSDASPSGRQGSPSPSGRQGSPGLSDRQGSPGLSITATFDSRGTPPASAAPRQRTTYIKVGADLPPSPNGGRSTRIEIETSDDPVPVPAPRPAAPRSLPRNIIPPPLPKMTRSGRRY